MPISSGVSARMGSPIGGVDALDIRLAESILAQIVEY
jgi:hypothetical protein